MQGDFGYLREFRAKYWNGQEKRLASPVRGPLVEGMIEMFAKGGYNLRLTFPHPS